MHSEHQALTHIPPCTFHRASHRQVSTAQGNAQWQGKSLGTPLGHRIFIFLLRNFGLGAAYALLWPVALWYVFFAPEAGRAVRVYLRHLHGTDQGWRTKAYAIFRVFGKALIDRVAVRSGMLPKFELTQNGSEHIKGMVAQGKGGILISAHLGNWEFAGHMLKRHNAKVSVVMVNAEREAIKKAVERGAEKPHFEVIPSDEGVGTTLAINAALAEGRLICLHGDRRLPHTRARRVTFLEAPALIPLGPFALASASGAPVSFCFVVRRPNVGYHFTATVPVQGRSPNELIDAYVAALEEATRAHPDQWFNFFDFWADADDPTAGARRRATLPTAAPAHGDGARAGERNP